MKVMVSSYYFLFYELFIAFTKPAEAGRRSLYQFCRRKLFMPYFRIIAEE